MNDYSLAELETTSSQIPFEQKHSIFLIPRQLCRLFRFLAQWPVKDWHTHKYFCFAALLLLLTVIPTVVYYLNYPQPELNADTPGYLHVVEGLQTHILLVDAWRLPGYPLLIMLVYTLAGQGNLMAVSIAQAALFVLATLEIYVVAILLFRRTWLAFLIGLLVGTNLVLLSYIKPIMSEGLALWLLTTLVLSVVYFIHTLRRRAFWFVVISLLPLIFTRPEWVYLPVPLFAYLLLVAHRQQVTRHLFWHALVASTLIYTIVGSYIGINTLANHYFGLTANDNFNLMGKVLQYNMQDEVDPQYINISQQLDTYVARGDRDPYRILPRIPEFSRDNCSPAGNFARTIILHHPVEFLLKSVPMFFLSLTSYYDSYRVSIPGPFDEPLAWLKSIHRMLYGWNALFPLCSVAWSILLCRRRTKSYQMVVGMGAIVLVVLYALIITTLGGYRIDDYMRVHIVFNPLLILVVWGSLFLGVQFLAKQKHCILAQFSGRIFSHGQRKQP